MVFLCHIAIAKAHANKLHAHTKIFKFTTKCCKYSTDLCHLPDAIFYKIHKHTHAHGITFPVLRSTEHPRVYIRTSELSRLQRTFHLENKCEICPKWPARNQKP